MHTTNSCQRERERGSITVWIVMLCFTSIVLVGFVVDVSGQIKAQQRTHAIAAQAARAAGQRLETRAAVRGIVFKVDAVQAINAGQAYLTNSGVSGTVILTDGGTTITVTAQDTYTPKILSIIGITDVSVSSKATARVVQVMGGVES